MAQFDGTFAVTGMTGQNVLKAGSIITQDIANGAVTVDKILNNKSTITFPINISKFEVMDGATGFVSPVDFIVEQLSMYVANKGTSGVTQVTARVNGSPILTAPLQVSYDSNSNFATVKFVQMINVAANSEVLIDIKSVGYSASGLTILMSGKTLHVQ